jgi:hypothetical protein
VRGEPVARSGGGSSDTGGANRPETSFDSREPGRNPTRGSAMGGGLTSRRERERSRQSDQSTCGRTEFSGEDRAERRTTAQTVCVPMSRELARGGEMTEAVGVARPQAVNERKAGRAARGRPPTKGVSKDTPSSRREMIAPKTKGSASLTIEREETPSARRRPQTRRENWRGEMTREGPRATQQHARRTSRRGKKGGPKGRFEKTFRERGAQSSGALTKTIAHKGVSRAFRRASERRQWR